MIRAMSKPLVFLGISCTLFSFQLRSVRADAVDYFVETVDPKDPLRYQHRGQWKTTERLTEEIAVRGAAPRKLEIDSTIHGPIIHRQDRAIALQWTGLKPSKDMAALWNISHAKTMQPYLKGLEDLTAPALNMIYADDAGNIQRVAEELKNWNYVADTSAIGPVIWLRWFDQYRAAVWNDEWSSRGIQQPEGSWGFSGTNRREPMLEVFEYMTREFPDSIWFDDRATPERETRDDILRKSFAEVVEQLVKEFGSDPAQWRWGKINQLQIGSLTQLPELARPGGPVVGTCFTVNPGSNVGRVGGGASWRMIVDLAHVARRGSILANRARTQPAQPMPIRSLFGPRANICRSRWSRIVRNFPRKPRPDRLSSPLNTKQAGLPRISRNKQESWRFLGLAGTIRS